MSTATMQGSLRRYVPAVTGWRITATLLLALGAVAAIQRFVLGLGRTTHLTDFFPWGLWIGLDFLGIGLAAAGFTIVATVHLLNIHRFEPIVRPAILTAFIGYMLVVAVLVLDLGRPDRFWHPLVMWNPHSVMFEITWCLILYSTVLAFEFAPVILERFRITAPIPILRAISLPLMLAGVILSTLHQSSFGSLYLIVPRRLHPLWYSPVLPVLFYISCIAAGLSTVILLSLRMTRTGERHIPMDLLPALGKVVAVVLAIYGTVRVQDLMDRNALGLAGHGYQGSMFAAEFGFGVLLPIVVLAIRPLRESRAGLFTACMLVLVGFAANRMNTVVTGLEAWPSRTYFPSWQEVATGVGIATLGISAFVILSRLLDIIPRRSAAEAVAAADGARGVPPAMMSHGRPGLLLLAATATALFVAGVLLVSSFADAKRQAVPVGPAASGPPDVTRGLARFDPPGEFVIASVAGSPGPVRFHHAAHVDSARPECASCHDGTFSIVQVAGPVPRGAPMHDKTRCGKCHDVERDCTHCHGN